MERDPHRTLRAKTGGKTKQMAAWLGRLCMSVSDVTYLLFAENFHDYIRHKRPLAKAPTEEMMILANGPSLNEVLATLRREHDKYAGYDFFFVNYLAEDDIFDLIKPRHYCLSDPQFFMSGYPKSDQGRRLLHYIHQRTSWDMNLYVQYIFKDTVKWLETNPHIKVVPFHSNHMEGFKWLRLWLMGRGLGNGEYGTVVQNAIYISTHLGYHKLHLYGVDHNFFDDLCLDEHGVLCSRVTHFYDNGKKQELRPVRIAKDTLSVGEFLTVYATLFDGYYKLKEYADKRGCSIVNHTRGSLIDAFEKDPTTLPEPDARPSE